MSIGEPGGVTGRSASHLRHPRYTEPSRKIKCTICAALSPSTGQIELYTHLPVMKYLVEQLQQWEFRVCGVFLVDSQFMVESFKFISGVMAALSAMVSLEIPQCNLMTKMDLLSKKAKKEMENIVRFLPFDRSDEESMNIVLQHIDFSIQYGEDLEFKEPKELEEDKSQNVDEFFQDQADED
ncbi:TPA: hypothetical protein GDO54_018414 [Pyxicephalus adspersus]|uniref:GPN-loop GTPase 3 n=1 Tax=Pyxicephalus adspersus TaxID=30357 RepID=A0AAV2ZM80_PYXAD|nr:TPA: hypothetical protein GDO54_018414 [Pyxicephalus adspersus]